MAGKYQELLNSYYLKNSIHPEKFDCQFQYLCRMSAHKGNMTETKMSMVGSRYGETYPRIAVISLDPPSDEDKEGRIRRWDFRSIDHRTTEYISSTHEKDDYVAVPPNPHWAMTQVIVKDLLVLFGYPSKPNSAIASTSFSGRSIENVSAFFAHINMAKCSMNRPGQGKAPASVHKRCSGSYLAGELAILEPDMIISQGDTTNRILGKMFIAREVLSSELPKVEKVELNGRNPIWMPMVHPTTQYHKIWASWHVYETRVKQLSKSSQ